MIYNIKILKNTHGQQNENLASQSRGMEEKRLQMVNR